MQGPKPPEIIAKLIVNFVQKEDLDSRRSNPTEAVKTRSEKSAPGGNSEKKPAGKKSRERAAGIESR